MKPVPGGLGAIGLAVVVQLLFLTLFNLYPGTNSGFLSPAMFVGVLLLGAAVILAPEITLPAIGVGAPSGQPPDG
ncbi:hypothetical protein [Micromonospora sp. NPDC093277]|uniref:hypothetical protein n=1 Tax=Micromonospora sp. NPDC093277 TaxID=3364291 RepID=UPI00381F1A62